MFDPATKEFLESGNALIVATVSADGEPHASRGWGLTVLPGDDRHMRLLLSVDDLVTQEHARAGGAIAVAELFNQTPGPGAGERVTGGGPLTP